MVGKVEVVLRGVVEQLQVKPVQLHQLVHLRKKHTLYYPRLIDITNTTKGRFIAIKCNTPNISSKGEHSTIFIKGHEDSSRLNPILKIL